MKPLFSMFPKVSPADHDSPALAASLGKSHTAISGSLYTGSKPLAARSGARLYATTQRLHPTAKLKSPLLHNYHDSAHIPLDTLRPDDSLFHKTGLSKPPTSSVVEPRRQKPAAPRASTQLPRAAEHFSRAGHVYDNIKCNDKQDGRFTACPSRCRSGPLVTTLEYALLTSSE